MAAKVPAKSAKKMATAMSAPRRAPRASRDFENEMGTDGLSTQLGVAHPYGSVKVVHVVHEGVLL